MASTSAAGAESQVDAGRTEQTPSDNSTDSPPQTKTSSSDSMGDLLDTASTPNEKTVSPCSSILNYGDNDQDEDLSKAPSVPSSPAMLTASNHKSRHANSTSATSGSFQNGLKPSDIEECHVEDRPDEDNYDSESICSSTIQYCQEQFHIYKFKVIQLCRDIGLGEPRKIERMEGGSFNRVIGLTFPSGDKPEYVLRVPRYALDEDQTKDIIDQVSVQLHLAKCDSLPVASVAAYDSTTNNAINSQYVLQERLHGETLCDIFYDLPLCEKLQIATKTAEIILKLESIKVDKPGRLVGADDLPPFSHPPAVPLADIKISGFRDHPMSDGPGLEKQPLASFIWELLEHRKEIYEDMPHLVERCEKLQVIALEMQSAGLVRVADSDTVLWHWDLSASNILARQVTTPAEGDHDDCTISCGRDNRILSLSTNDKHKSVLCFNDTYHQGIRHNIRVETECGSSAHCQHTVGVTIEHSSGHVFQQTTKVTHNNNYGREHSIATSNKSTPGNEVPDHTEDQQESSASQVSPTGVWELSGILDWDDALAVPLVLSRKPPTWLWLNEHDRASSWRGDRDEKPHRDLTEDELLIKAHFDQIMTRASPTWMDDAYGRGVWLRALARYGLYPFEDGVNYSNYDDFIAAWDEFNQSIAR
ncbi:hypothetical protein BKA64DRAFT_677302 [Cadophora sp. MPI-SDFR-AT-0126]|nr:hypothetical protein BKA64DRAFT_677302 [Leotiomycetes sp. MPI-SDFR-AT-0126]